MRKRGSKFCGTPSVLCDCLDDKRSLEVLCSVGEEPCQLPMFRMDGYIFVFSSEQGRRPDRPLAKHERESIDALAEAAGVEANFIAVIHE